MDLTAIASGVVVSIASFLLGYCYREYIASKGDEPTPIELYILLISLIIVSVVTGIKLGIVITNLIY